MLSSFPPIFLFFALAGLSCASEKEEASFPEEEEEEEEAVVNPFPAVSWTGSEDGEALGSALAFGDGVWFAGAPGGETGRVYQGSAEGLSLYLEEEGRGALGHALAVHPTLGLLAGAPLRHEAAGAIVNEAGEHRTGAESAVLGTRLRVRGEHLLALSALEYWVDETAWSTSARPSDIDLLGEEVVVAFSRGDTALVSGEWSLNRPEALDEAGFSLCAADFDEDGQMDLALGAPGANRVYLFRGSEGWDFESASVLQGPGGRFGHALACHEATLVVGAPLHLGLRGAAWRFQGEPTSWTVLEPWIEGEEDGDQLGFALATNGQFVLLGAPGLATGPGKVVCAP